jgi:hypothetical protein
MSRAEVHQSASVELRPGLDSGRRPLRDSLSEIAGVSIVGAVLSGLSATVRFTGPPVDPWFSLEIVGARTIEDASWVLPTLVVVLVAFYGALLGQAIVSSDAATLVRTRNRLALGGILIGGLTVDYLALCITGTVGAPSLAPRLVAVIGLGAVVIGLGAGTASFAFGSLQERLNQAEIRVMADQKTLQNLPGVPSRRREWLTFGISAFVIVLLPPIVAVSAAAARLIPTGWGTLSIFYSVLVLAGGLLILPVTSLILADRGGAWSKAAYAPIAVPPVVLIMVIAFSYASPAPYPAHVIGWSATSVLMLVAVLSVVPALVPLPNWSWTIGAALLTRARRGVQRDLDRHIARRDELAAALVKERQAAASQGAMSRLKSWLRGRR